jgi:hypothetical protein
VNTDVSNSLPDLASHSALQTSESPLTAPSPQSQVPSPQPPARTGRPRTLDETKLGEICALISAGCGLEWAARYVGCAASTIRREARRNRQFRDRLRRASMEAEIAPLRAVRRAAETHWRAGVWYLKQLHAQRATTIDVRYLKSQKLNEFANEVHHMLRSTIGDVDVLRNVLHRLQALVDKANSKPPVSKHVAFPIDVDPNKG